MSLKRQTVPEKFEGERFFDFKNKAGKPLNDYLEPWTALMLYGYVSYFDDAWQELKRICEDASGENEWNDKLSDFTTRVYLRTGVSDSFSTAFIKWKLNKAGYDTNN